jgi:drug/metabolite transporter (DMT)-like permease
MGTFERIVRALIYVCFIAAAYYLIIWVIGQLGIALPAMVMHILAVILVLFAILILVRLLGPVIGGYDWLGRDRDPRP